jgi:uncharacterized protein (TIGR02246 family)
MKVTAIVGLTLLSATMIGMQATGQAAAQGADAASAAIKQVADNYVKATSAGDAKAVAALYTEDAVEMPPNQPIIKGRAAIQAYYEKLFSSMKVSNFTLTHVESHATGDRGYDVGTYQQSMAQPSAATPTSDTGKYVVILKRTAGVWKVAYAIYNSDQTPPTGR